MGQRGGGAAFMPNKFVFPGGALDPADHRVALAQGMADDCMARLRARSDPKLAEALILAGIRETWEETGLMLGEPTDFARDNAAQQPENWQGFFASGLAPSARGMTFVFRAITPPMRPRRFDARFFLVDAQYIAGDPDDFSAADSELSHLQWIPLRDVRGFDLPFVTEVVLAEIEANLKDAARPKFVPFFYHEGTKSNFLRL